MDVKTDGIDKISRPCCHQANIKLFVRDID